MKNLITILVIVMIIVIIKQDEFKKYLKRWMNDHKDDEADEPASASFSMTNLKAAVSEFFTASPINAIFLASEERRGENTYRLQAAREISSVVPGATPDHAMQAINVYMEQWKTARYRHLRNYNSLN